MRTEAEYDPSKRSDKATTAGRGYGRGRPRTVPPEQARKEEAMREEEGDWTASLKLLCMILVEELLTSLYFQPVVSLSDTRSSYSSI